MTLGQPKKYRGYNEGLSEIVNSPFVELIGHVSICYTVDLQCPDDVWVAGWAPNLVGGGLACLSGSAEMQTCIWSS